MSGIPEQAGLAPNENGAAPEKKKRTWLVCCCAGSIVMFLAFVVAGLLYWSLLTPFLREILVSR